MKKYIDFGRYTVIDDKYMLVKVVPNTNNECCIIDRDYHTVLASGNTVTSLMAILRQYTKWSTETLARMAESYIEIE